MRDKWMNIGHEDEELKPHIEPVKDYSDPVRIGNGIEEESIQTSSLSHLDRIPMPKILFFLPAI